MMDIQEDQHGGVGWEREVKCLTQEDNQDTEHKLHHLMNHCTPLNVNTPSHVACAQRHTPHNVIHTDQPAAGPDVGM